MALQQVCEAEFQKLLSGLPHDQYLVACGRLQSKLEVLTLPDTLDQKAKEIDEHRRPADQPDPARRDLTFFGSQYWSPSRQPTVHKPTGTAG